VRFPHNDAWVMTVYIECCKVSKILVNKESSVNILYGHPLDRMEDTPELAQKLIIPQTDFDENEACSPDTVEFPVCANPFNVVTEFCILDIEFPYNAILRRS